MSFYVELSYIQEAKERKKQKTLLESNWRCLGEEMLRTEKRKRN
jgi:hypothetical protein